MGNTMAPPVERLAYSVPEAALASGIGRSTLYVLMDEGALAFVKVRGRRLILVSALRSFLGDDPNTPSTPPRRNGARGNVA